MKDKSFAEVTQSTICGTGNLVTLEFNKDVKKGILKEAESAAEKGSSPTLLKEREKR